MLVRCFGTTNVKWESQTLEQFEHKHAKQPAYKETGMLSCLLVQPFDSNPIRCSTVSALNQRIHDAARHPDDVAPKNSTSSPASVIILADRTMTHHGSELVCTSHNGTSRSAVTWTNQNCPVDSITWKDCMRCPCTRVCRMRIVLRGCSLVLQDAPEFSQLSAYLLGRLHPP